MLIFKNKLLRMSALERKHGRFMRGPEEHEGSVEIDMEAAQAEISESLFGQDDAGEKISAEEPEVVVETPATPAPTPEPTPTPENSEAVVETGAPKTWTKEALADWAAIPPRAQQEILKREDDMFRGMEQYKERAELGTQYDKVVEPYKAALAAEGVNPVELFNNFAANHYMLARGTDEQKLEIAANLMTHYGIDPTALIMRLGSDAPKPDPKYKELETRFQSLEQQLTQRQQQEQQARREEYDSQVAAFSADPKNTHFQDVASDMANLLKTEAASSLQQAYEMAVWNNPVTRAKEIDRLQNERDATLKAQNEEKLKAARKAQGANVDTSTKTRDGTVPVGSMDETLEETMAQIKSRG